MGRFRCWLVPVLLSTACSTGGAGSGGPGLFGSGVTVSASGGDQSTASEETSDGATASSGSASEATTGGSESAHDTTTAVCGDDNLQDGESCDGLEFGDSTCATLGFDDGVLGCNAVCHILTDACFTCGDGEIALAETCDGTNFNGETCASMGFLGGALSCAPDCSMLNTAQCQPLPSCGDGVRNNGEQCDAADFGANSCISQGFDLGNIACTANCILDTSGCMDDLVNCGMMGDFCLFNENDLQSSCCPAGVGGNVLGICNIVVCV